MVLVQVPQCAQTRRNTRSLRRRTGVTSQDRQKSGWMARLPQDHIQRLFSAYLPPIAGWFTLVWMRKREYL